MAQARLPKVVARSVLSHGMVNAMFDELTDDSSCLCIGGWPETTILVAADAVAEISHLPHAEAALRCFAKQQISVTRWNRWFRLCLGVSEAIPSSLVSLSGLTWTSHKTPASCARRLILAALRIDAHDAASAGRALLIT
jgi:hypothetical protein